MAELERLEAVSSRMATPCGDGGIVWHVWGERQNGDLPLVLFHGGSGSWTHWLRSIHVLSLRW